MRLNFTALWILAALTGLAENLLLHKFGLDVAQRTAVAVAQLPLLIFLVLVCVFQQIALGRKID